MSKYLTYFGLVFIFLSIIFSFGLQKAKAADYPLVINEIYPNVNSGEVEWIELFNPSSDFLSLVDYAISDGTTAVKDLSSYSITAKGYLVLRKGTDFSFGLNDPGDIVKLKKINVLIDQVAYGNWDDGNISDNAPVPLKGQSIARIPNGYDSDNDRLDFNIQTQFTPGLENPSPVVNTPVLLSPQNNSVIIGDKEIEFDYQLEPNLKDRLIISKYSDLSDPLSDISELDWGKFYWAVEASYGNDKKISDIWSFELKDYSKNIIINELLPHPEDGTDFEFIELYNNSEDEVDLGGWILSDGVTNFPIPLGIKISPFGYLVFYKTETKISLNDSGDTIQLFFPNGEVADLVLYGSADLQLAWARGPNGDWSWTDMSTPSAQNIIHIHSDLLPNFTDEDVPVNSEPVEIATGDFRNYENYLVTVLGEVVETSGSTFYLDDGTGRVKIYIQAKTGIKKPEMHKGDIFLITGVVDLYGKTWRILPRTIDDIRLVEKKTVVAKNATKKKTLQTAKKTLASTSIKPAINSVKAASTENQKSNQNSASFLRQLIMLTTSLAVIFLVLLIVKVIKRPRENVIGGHFGEDET